MMTPLLLALALGSAPSSANRVLVIWNNKAPESQALAQAYARSRSLPAAQVLEVSVAGEAADREEMNVVELRNNVFTAIRKRVGELGRPIDFIVLMKGFPLRVWDDAHFSVDSYISTMDMDLKPARKIEAHALEEIRNPYFGKNEPFSKKKYGFYLVTRLDGYSFSDARELITRAQAAKPHKGPFFFDAGGGETNPAKLELHEDLKRASAVLRQKGFEATTDTTQEFKAPSEPLAGYTSWGSNDLGFSQERYRKLKFKPGALVETFVSTSARTMRPVTSGQSVITDLIAGGATGIKGYVKEPYTFALARPSILFDRYTSGYTLAESYYMASPMLKWKDVVIGDPILAPYKK